MAVKKRKLIFELSRKEKEDRLKKVLRVATEKAMQLGQPMVYRNELCTKPNLFIHQYPNGRKELIEQDPKNSAEKTILILA